MEEAVVLFPSPSMQSHLVPTVEFAKLILTHHPSTFSITILVLDPPPNSENYIAAVSTATKNINFHILSPLPDHDIPPDLSRLELHFELPRRHNPNIHKALEALSQKTKLKAFVIDFFCFAAAEVSKSLNIPTYYFFTSGGSVLAFLLYFPSLVREHGKRWIKVMEFPVSVPGLPPVPPSDIPSSIQDPTSNLFKHFLNSAIHMAESAGIIVNTFESLEERSLKALRDGLCVPEKQTPPIFSVGPLLSTRNNLDLDREDEFYCLSWLNQQPSKSVVFLCFGSVGVFPAKQLFEMAVGLEDSGHRFLWVVRDPPEDKKISLDEILPKGFLERTKERGLVVRQWAPQVKILSHDSVGAFVTHCGWNSVLESVCAGVPMVAWPLYAEQTVNKVFLVEEMGAALAVNESGEDGGLVSGAELEERIRELMDPDSDSERGRDVRKRVLMMRDEAINAMGNAGSSRLALTKLTEQWKQN